MKMKIILMKVININNENMKIILMKMKIILLMY